MIAFVFAPLITVTGQFLDSLIIKTHPLRDLVAFNPNIGFEKIINKKYSFEIELTYKARDNESSGKGFDMWNYKKSSGGRVLIGMRRYFIKSKKVTNAWYLSGQIGYRDIYLTNFRKIDIAGSYLRTVNINKKDYEINLLIGREFPVFKNILTEINFGVGLCSEKYREKYLEGNMAGHDFNNGYFNTSGIGPIFYVNWAIGYVLIKSKKASPQNK